jgi:hypothetical protein
MGWGMPTPINLPNLAHLAYAFIPDMVTTAGYSGHFGVNAMACKFSLQSL